MAGGAHTPHALLARRRGHGARCGECLGLSLGPGCRRDGELGHCGGIGGGSRPVCGANVLFTRHRTLAVDGLCNPGALPWRHAARGPGAVAGVLIESIARGAQVFQGTTQSQSHHAVRLETDPGGVHLLEIVIAEFDHAAGVRRVVATGEVEGEVRPGFCSSFRGETVGGLNDYR